MKAGVIIQSESKGLRLEWGERPDGITPSLSPDVQEQEVTGSSAQAGPPLFCRYGPSTDWIISICIGEDHLPALLHLVIPMLISSRNTLMHTPRNNVSPALCASLSLVRLTHDIKTITSADKPEKGGN